MTGGRRWRVQRLASSQRRLAAGAAVATLALWMLGTPCMAQVKLKTLANGTRVMTNEGAPRRQPTVSRRPKVEIDGLIDVHARQQGLDPRLVEAVVQAESSYDPAALSRKGAMGLMQLMPATARSLEVDDPYDPEQNLRAGTTYLRRMLDRFDGDLELALASYNAGPDAVHRYRGLPPYPETYDYVDRVLRLFRGEGLGPERARPPAPRIRGRRTFLSRDASGRLLMSTTPPTGR